MNTRSQPVDAGNNGHALYRLPDVMMADRIYITESKEAADAARTVGLTATTAPHGKNAGKIDWSPLADKAVVVLPDHDAAGETYARDVARLALAAGAKSARIVPMVAICPGRVLRIGYSLADAAAECPDDDERMGLRMVIEEAEGETPVVTAESLRADETTADYPPSPGDHKPEVVLQGVTCRELAAAEYTLTFLVDHSIVEASPLLIGAAPKCCKTLLALDAAVSLATATPFLGVLAVPEACRTGLLSGEGGLPVLQEYARRIADGRGLDLADIDGLIFCDTLPQLGDLRHLDALERFLMDWELRVVILDPLYLCMPGDNANNLLQQGKILGYLNQLCLKNGATPILIHHTKRNPIDPFAPPELSDLSWAGFSEFAGQWWLIGRREKYNADQPGEHKLWLNVGGRAGHSALHALDVHEGRRSDPAGRRWDVEVLRPSEARQTATEAARERREVEAEIRRAKKLERCTVKLSRALAKFPEGETERTLRDRAGLSSGEFKAAMAALLDDDQVEQCEIVKANRKTPYPGFKVKDTPQ